MARDLILVVNAGSSSIKVAVFDVDLAVLTTASVTEIGDGARLKVGADESVCTAPDHAQALERLLGALDKAGYALSRLAAAGHRVVHGGRDLTASMLVTEAVEARIAACIPLAPLHNPHNLSPILALRRLAPDLPQIACFDTAFHATNPEVALRYALPATEEAKGIRRYGFHGISYASLSARVPDLLGRQPERLLALHLGNGASLCAIRSGVSVASSMGYSPVEGLTMGTRTGTIDAMAVLRLAQDHGIEGAARLLNRESGLKALGGASDMRALHAAGTDEAAFAIRHFCYWAVRHAGSAIAAMGGLDCVAFTGGIGENDAHVRAEIAAGLGFAGVALDDAANTASAMRIDRTGSAVPVLIIAAEEERFIAAETLTVMRDARGSLR